MDYGLAYFPSHDALAPGPLAKLLEERGHRWLVFPEHTHIPASRETPWGGVGGAPPLPPWYHKTYDLFVAIGMALAATTSMRVGTGICLITQRDPIITAKQVASLDHLSGGRFDFGVGAGWNREELRNHGTDPRVRTSVMRERVLAMKEIWTKHEASFEGEFVNFDRIWCEPKPMQRPHPPVLVGGDGPKVFDRVLEFGDAWFPGHDAYNVLPRIRELHERAGRIFPVVLMGPPADPVVLETYAAAGVQRVMFWLPSGKRTVIEDRLDEIERAMAPIEETLDIVDLGAIRDSDSKEVSL